jgi:RNase H-fold protein (predicted Holliday junction resolvase)
MTRAAGLVAGLDPGRSKCGLVLADPAGSQILQAAILAPQACLAQLQAWRQEGLGRVVLGNGTGSEDWRRRLDKQRLALVVVDESGSTLAARERYWQLWPPRGWRLLLPAGLRLPPRDIDDVVAQLLIERHYGLQLRRSNQEVLRQWPPLATGI